MLQAEVGSAKLTPASSYPSRGHVMWDFTLPSAEGKQVSLYDYRGRCNLVLLFAGDADNIGDEKFLSTLVQHYTEIRDQDSEVLLVIACSREQAEQVKHQAQLPFPVLADEDMRVHRSVGAISHQTVAAAALYVTDRFFRGVCRVAYRGRRHPP